LTEFPKELPRSGPGCPPKIRARRAGIIRGVTPEVECIDKGKARAPHSSDPRSPVIVEICRKPQPMPISLKSQSHKPDLKNFKGGSDARIIMGKDEKALLGSGGKSVARRLRWTCRAF
jgi:hypothetical protein